MTRTVVTGIKTPDCVFCGHEAHVVGRSDTNGAGQPFTLFNVYCICCGAQGPTAPTIRGAIRMWRFKRAAK